MGKTLAEKLLAKKAGLKEVTPGQIVTVHPDHLLMHDNAAAIIGKIKNELDEFGIINPHLPIIVLDHVVPAANEKTAANHKLIREFVERHGLVNFFDAGEGICHQVVIEKGFARPGSIIVGSDSHTCSYGAVGAFSTGIDRTEAAALLLTGETWLKVPQSIKISLRGRFNPGVSAKDLILTIIGAIKADGANYCSVEFHGDLTGLSMEDRITIANMGVEMGAKTAMFPVDGITRTYLDSLRMTPDSYDIIWSDDDAHYIIELDYDIAAIEPVIALPHTVDNISKIEAIAGMKIDQCLLGTCTNGRLVDIEKAAAVLKGRKISKGVRFLVLPASRAILNEALRLGYIETLSQAGAIILPPGCGPCLGAHLGVLAPGEKCLSTANRNFKGRMGCKDADIYLSSPETVAVSAIFGVITDPRNVIRS